MAATAKQLSVRFREVLLNGTWIANTNFKDQLQQTDVAIATFQVGNLNTIAALTFHVNYYIKGVLEVLQGGELTIRDRFSFDAPDIHHQADWVARKDELYRNAERFARALEQLSETRLEQPFVKEAYGTYRRNVEAMIEHCYYHLGQVVMLRKWIIETKDLPS